jgi:hypothetical protein
VPNNLLKSVIAVLAGLVVAGVILVAVGETERYAFAPPPGADLSDPAVMQRHVDSLPWIAFFFPIVGLGVAAAVGASLASRLAPASGPTHGLVLGGLILLAGLAGMVGAAQPIWAWIGALVVVPAASLMGGKSVSWPAAES